MNGDDLRARLATGEPVLMPGVWDALSARLSADAGFDTVFLSGYCVSGTLLGVPDIGYLTQTEMAEVARRVCNAAPDTMVVVDADTGYGNASSTIRTVELWEAAGATGIFIEDQVWPKRCGHMAGKAVVPRAEWLAKIKAALDARDDADFVVMARTDAIAVNGLDDAIERAQLAREAGADLLFVEAPIDVDQMRRLCREIPGPCLANNVESGLSPLLPADELQAIGYAAVVFPVSATYAVAHALRELFATLRRTGTTADALPRLASFGEFNELVGLSAQRRREADLQDYADALVARHANH